MNTVHHVDQAAPSSFKLHHSSPLDTLVRRTSSKRAREPSETQSQRYLSHLIDSYAARTSQDEDDEAQYVEYSQDVPLTPPSHHLSRAQLAPHSPLLHSRFTRDSTATASVTGSFADTRVSVDSRNVYQDLEYRYRDSASVYSQQESTMAPALHDSWSSIRASGVVHRLNPPSAVSSSDDSSRIYQSSVAPESSQPWTSSVPTLVVSSPDVDNAAHRAGRAPIVKPMTSNFSRPLRHTSPSSPSQRQDADTARPPPPSEEQKRRVLERNASRTTPSSLQATIQQNRQYMNTRPEPPVNPYLVSSHTQGRESTYQTSSSDQPGKAFPNPYTDVPSVAPLQITKHKPTTSTHLDALSFTDNRSRSPSPQRSHPTQGRLSPQPPLNQTKNRLSPQPHSSSLNVDGKQTSQAFLTPHSPNSVVLPGRPPSRSNSPASLYSTYSFYNYDSGASSPVGQEFRNQIQPGSAQSQQADGHLQPNATSSKTNSQPSLASKGNRAPNLTDPQTPQDYLQLGIQHHEANRLTESAVCFERSAKENGGCGVGMLMWGLALRHGWGCEKNEKVGFKWLRKAAEHAVGDLESARDGNTVDTGSVQDELVLAIYEVGQCFFHGWGVPKDQKMAVSYYTVAARLGDPDAQNDLAFCLANGKGCKKDRKEAARWYREAVKQGMSDVGLAWIYKEKFL